MRIAAAILAWLTAFVPVQALAWGQEGHSVIGEIAQRRLSSEAAAAVQLLLGKGHSFAGVSSWADEIRSSRPTTEQWHFADIPLESRDYDPQRDCQPDPAKGDCIVAEIERLRTELRCGPNQEKMEALMFAVHFVGDIHQPLHTVKDQRGGNDIGVTITAKGLTGCPPDICLPKTTFHRAWDTDLIHKTVFSWGGYVERLETGWLKGGEAQKVGIDGGKAADWAVETHQYAQKVWHLLPQNNEIDDNYYTQVLPVMDRQLGMAGMRLARFLNEIFGSPKCPIR
jgi:hypothetical protein